MKNSGKDKEKNIDPYSTHLETDVEYVSEDDEKEVIQSLSYDRGGFFNEDERWF